MRVTSPFLAAVSGGLVSGAAVAGVLFATGAIGDEGPDEPARAPAPVRTSVPAAVTLTDIYRNARRGVVVVEGRQPGMPWPQGPPTEDDGVATGSGFAIGGGRVVTNHHVVAGADEVAVRGSGRRVPARVVGSDPSTDLALLRVRRDRGPQPATLPLGDSESVRPGDPVVVIGNPLGLARTLTAGVVSAVHRRIDAPDGFPIRGAIQTDAAVNPGNSGGPLLDERGRVIGVIAQGRGDGIAFAVPADVLKQVAPELEQHGRVRRPFLGVTTTVVARGARVVEAVAHGPAARAGIRRGDVIVSVAGTRVRDARDVADAILGRSPRERVTIEYLRDRDRRSVEVVLGVRPAR
jgi:S1-C subfamily serine protease